MVVHFFKLAFLILFVCWHSPAFANKSAKDLFLIGFEADRNFMQENKIQHYLNVVILKLEELKPHLLVGAGLDFDHNGQKDTYLEVFGWSMDDCIKESTERGYGVSEDLGFIKETTERLQREAFPKIENAISQIDPLLARLRDRITEAEQKKRGYKNEACSAYTRSKILSQSALNRNLEGAFLPALVFGSACEKLVCYSPGESPISSATEKEIIEGAEAALAAAQLAEVGKEGVPKDLGVAYLWNLRAADGKNPEAIVQTALRLKAGIGMPKDEARSQNWMRSANSEKITFNGITFRAVDTRKGRKHRYVVIDNQEFEIESEHDKEIDYDLEYITKENEKYLVITLNDHYYVADSPEDQRYALEVNGQKIYYKVIKDATGKEKKVFELDDEELLALRYLHESHQDAEAEDERGCCERRWCCCCPGCGSACDRFKNRTLYFTVGFLSTAIASVTSVVTAYSKIDVPETANLVVALGIPATAVVSCGAGIISAWYTNKKEVQKKTKKESTPSRLEEGTPLKLRSVPRATQAISDQSSQDLPHPESQEQKSPKSTVVEIYEDSDSTEDQLLTTAAEDRLRVGHKLESIDDETTRLIKKTLADQHNGKRIKTKVNFKEVALQVLEKNRQKDPIGYVNTKEEDVPALLETMKPNLTDKAVSYMYAKADLARSKPIESSTSSTPEKRKIKRKKKKPLKAPVTIQTPSDTDESGSGGEEEGPLEIDFGSLSSGD